METFGFYHPDHGYWETTNHPSQDILDSYPAGTVEYPVKPGNDYKPVDGGWAYVAPEPVPVILEPVTRRQLRLTLVRERISLATVEALIAAMPEGLQKEEAEIEWVDAQTFDRNHPTLLLIAQALNLTTAKVDEMWLKAMVA